MEQDNGPRVPPDIEEAIYEEEKLRLRVRAELADAAQKVTGSDKPLTFWTFLNSQFALFLMGAIFVSGLGGAFTLWHQSHQERNQRIVSARRLLAEFDFRLNELDTRIKNLSTIPEADGGAESTYVWRVARGDSAFQPALPEFKNVHWAGIVIQLDTLGFGDETSKAVQATRDLENGGSIRTTTGYSLYPAGFLASRSATLHKFRDAAWSKVDPTH